MNKEMDIKDMVPVKTSERHVILDALRGFALLGICLANFPEFSLYTFQKLRITEAMPTAEIDKVVRFLQYLFVDGKFYTIFIIRKSKFPQNPKRSVRFSGKRTKRSVQKRKARNTQKAETKVL